jgi:uncharacterized protein YjaZ
LKRHFIRILAVVVCLVAPVACGQTRVTVGYRGGHTFSRNERNVIEAIAERAAKDVGQMLPALAAELTITVQIGTRVIPETGETGSVGLPNHVYWTVDPTHDSGVLGVAQAQLRATLFHELYHLVRETQVDRFSLLDRAVNEGLATAFERDFGGAPVPWGVYPDNVEDWTREFLALPADAPHDQWMSRHSDGRRWIGYKVGTHLADEAARVSGLSLAQLVTMPTERIVEWAQTQ